MKFNFELTIKHIFVILGLMVTTIIGILLGRAMFLRPVLPALDIEYIDVIITKTVTESVTVDGGVIIEPVAGLMFIVAIGMLLLISRAGRY